jgi:hypothetical protein
MGNRGNGQRLAKWTTIEIGKSKEYGDNCDIYLRISHIMNWSWISDQGREPSSCLHVYMSIVANRQQIAKQTGKFVRKWKIKRIMMITMCISCWPIVYVYCRIVFIINARNRHEEAALFAFVFYYPLVKNLFKDIQYHLFNHLLWNIFSEFYKPLWAMAGWLYLFVNDDKYFYAFFFSSLGRRS